MALMWLHENSNVKWELVFVCPRSEEKKEAFQLFFFHNFICILSFQNYHELQPEGDPGSSVRSEPTPTLHVSKYSIFAFKAVLMCND